MGEVYLLYLCRRTDLVTVLFGNYSHYFAMICEVSVPWNNNAFVRARVQRNRSDKAARLVLLLNVTGLLSERHTQNVS